jgi:hypothetical protein
MPEDTKPVEKKDSVFAAIARSIDRASPTELMNAFRVWFRAFLATVMMLGGGVFLCVASFTPKEDLNEHTGVIVGFFTGSFITSALGFYFGGQDRSKKDMEGLDAENK